MNQLYVFSFVKCLFIRIGNYLLLGPSFTRLVLDFCVVFRISNKNTFTLKVIKF